MNTILRIITLPLLVVIMGWYLVEKFVLELWDKNDDDKGKPYYRVPTTTGTVRDEHE